MMYLVLGQMYEMLPYTECKDGVTGPRNEWKTGSLLQYYYLQVQISELYFYTFLTFE